MADRKILNAVWQQDQGKSTDDLTKTELKTGLKYKLNYWGEHWEQCWLIWQVQDQCGVRADWGWAQEQGRENRTLERHKMKLKWHDHDTVTQLLVINMVIKHLRQRQDIYSIQLNNKIYCPKRHQWTETVHFKKIINYTNYHIIYKEKVSYHLSGNIPRYQFICHKHR